MKTEGCGTQGDDLNGGLGAVINPPIRLDPGSVHCVLVGNQIKQAFATIRPCLPEVLKRALWWALFCPDESEDENA